MIIKIILILVSVIVTFFHLVLIRAQKVKWINLTKPLIIPSILLYYILAASQINIVIITALLLSLLGDILLMQEIHLFKFGLISFAAAHISYTLYFLFNSIKGIETVQYAVLLLPYAVLCVFIYAKLLKKSTFMKAYFVAYMVIIATMSYWSLCMVFAKGTLQIWMTFIGSLSFIVSDGALAFGLINGEKKNNPIIVMATYAAAQLLIVSGLL